MQSINGSRNLQFRPVRSLDPVASGWNHPSLGLPLTAAFLFTHRTRIQLNRNSRGRVNQAHSGILLATGCA